MRPGDRNLGKLLDSKLLLFHKHNHALPGINDPESRGVFVEQLIESIHRIKYVSTLLTRPIGEICADPRNELFDPLKAAIIFKRKGDIDEAFWMVFLFVHFGKHPQAGWRYAREIYGRLGSSKKWDWQKVSSNPSVFRAWLKTNQHKLMRNEMPRGFGNHRKYVSLNDMGTGAAVESYVDWISPYRTHSNLMQSICQQTNFNPKLAFDILYKSMAVVHTFGRTARFDYLTMIGKLKMGDITPGSVYLQNSTGPLRGAKLLFGVTNAKVNLHDLDKQLILLDSKLNVGMQVIEDALCNWQKSPKLFKRFRG